MAANATRSDNPDHTFPIRVLVDKEKNKVLFVEAGKDFIDVLLSFLTLPLGTIARLVAKESNVQPVKVGCLSSLYEGVSQFEEKHFRTRTCKELLLSPRNSMGDVCQQLMLNMNDMERTTNPSPFYPSFGGFVKEMATFIVSDDLHIMPNVFGASVNLFHKFGCQDMESVEEQTVDISKNEVVDLLKFSLISVTPMTDLILRKEQYLDNFTPTNKSLYEIGKVSSDECRQMIVKVQIRKSNGKILFAEAEEEFVNLLFSFLSFPLGGVVRMLEGLSSLNCIDKLYRSMNELSSDRCLHSHSVKAKLVNPFCAPHYNIPNQILPIGVESFPCSYSLRGGSFKNDGPKVPTGESTCPNGFVKGPANYMVMDDLVVTSMSSISAVSYLNSLKVSLSDVEERVIKIGVKEGLGILKASLTSTFALTDGLNHLLKPNEENNGPIGSVLPKTIN